MTEKGEENGVGGGGGGRRKERGGRGEKERAGLCLEYVFV